MRSKAGRRWSANASSGTLPIDNNPVEHASRPIAIGKKNWLFTGSERAGCRAAAIQSLFAITKLNGLDPARWLANALERFPKCPTARSIHCCHSPNLLKAKHAVQVSGWALTKLTRRDRFLAKIEKVTLGRNCIS